MQKCINFVDLVNGFPMSIYYLVSTINLQVRHILVARGCLGFFSFSKRTDHTCKLACLLAKIGVDTAENEPLSKFGGDSIQ